MSNTPQSITLSAVSFAYSGTAIPVFADVSVSFSRGWTAVLGDNGIGKTTLVRLAAGLEQPLRGTVTANPKQLVVGYCAQITDCKPQCLDDFAVDWSPETVRIRELLGICDDWPYRYGSLSGGEAKRMQLACALALRPDVLVLDEPTNYVDVPIRRAIAAAMCAFNGIGIVVSHDAELMDEVASRCVFLERRHVDGVNVTCVTNVSGSYSEAKAQLNRSERRNQSKLDQARHDARRLAQVSNQRRQDVAHANAMKQKSGRRIDPKDHDALQANRDARAMSVGGVAGASSARIDARLRAAKRAVGSIQVTAKRYDGEFQYDSQPSHRRELLHLDAGYVEYDGARFTSVPKSSLAQTDGRLRDSTAGADSSMDSSMPENRHLGFTIPTLSVGPRDHIGIIGPNGSGKSTLLTALLGYGLTGGFPYLVIEQTVGASALSAACRTFAGLPASLRSQVLANYARLNANPDRLVAAVRSMVMDRKKYSETRECIASNISDEYIGDSVSEFGDAPDVDNVRANDGISDTDEALSPGETQKLLICLGLLDSPQMLVLDEPTNHLDLHAREALSRMLAGFPGSVLVVSHDAWFLDQAAPNLRWRFEPERHRFVVERL